MKNLAIKIPFIHIAVLTTFILILALIIKQNTADINNEIFKFIYTLGYFLDNNILSFIFFFLLAIPIPLLGISILKKRRDLIIGFSISSFTSLTLLLLITFS